jgi:hypothetical protein
MIDVDELVARGDAEALAKLAEGSDKAVAKAARRGLHKLRSKGMKVAAPHIVREAPSAPVHAAAAEMPSLASSIDAAGERAIWLARNERDGVLVFEAYVHELNGLTQFRVTELGRKQWRKLVRELSEPKPHFSVAEVPADYARAEIEAAYQRNQATRRAAPVEYTRARPQLGKAQPLGQHPALAIEAPVPSREDLLRLHETPECRAWMPEPAEIERTAVKLQEVETSQLLVSPQQKTAAAHDAISRAVREYFADAGRRERMRKRLLDSAYLMQKLGREADALIARGAADQFTPEAATEESVFALQLFEKCFRLPGEKEEEPKAEKPGGLIIPP